jgi:undecaprenyl-diphosphatase
VITYLQAIVLGLLQGVTELFPISSLGHSVLVPALIGGSWQDLVTQSDTASSEGSPYLAFIVALHVATALALLVFFRADWVRIIRGFFRTLRPSWAARRIMARDGDERLAWLLVIGTIPVGITGLALEHVFRTATMPISAYRGDPPAPSAAGVPARERGRRRLTTLSYREAGIIGLFQTFALLAGISRSGIAMVGGLARGLSHRDAAHFSFLLATPVILAAGVLKLPSLAGPAGAHIHGQAVAGFLSAGLAAYVSVKWLTRWFETRTLIPFAIYCLVAGVACTLRFAL